MNHKWQKLKGSDWITEFTTHNHRIDSVSECINCGLRKGYCTTMQFFPVLVYYKEREVLSKRIIPFKCLEAPTMLFTEEEFTI